MSRISVDVSSARIPVLQVGYQGENEVTDVLFDISSWITEFGEGVAQLRVKRPGNSEEESYVLSLTITDGKAVWTVSETDTANKGNGKVQLSYMVGNIVKKAVIYPYKVGKSIVGADSPVDPFDSWIERSKAWAIGETLDGNAVPETDETYQNNAKYYAEQADILGSAQVGLATEQATLATEKATLATVKANAAAESEANAAASEAAVNGVSTQLTTRMSAIETEQSVQSARMDTFTSLPEGSTSGNAELADIRVGANGTTYDTAGNAVRGQIGELKSDINRISELEVTWITGKYIYKDYGVEVDGAAYKCTDFIPVGEIRKPFVYRLRVFSNIATYALYDSNKRFIRSVSSESESLEIVENVILPLDANVAYIRFTTEYTSGYVSYVKTGNINNIAIGNKAVDNEKLGLNAVELGNIGNSVIVHDEQTNFIDMTAITNDYYVNSTGGLSSANDYNVTDYIPLESEKTYYMLNVSFTYYAFYDENKNLISSYSTLGNLYSPFTTPANTAFGRFSLSDTQLASNPWISIYNAKPNSYKLKLNNDNINCYGVSNGANVENPCDYEGKEISVFNKICCIGDSITIGTFNHNEGGTEQYLVDTKYSYPTFLKKMFGVETANWGLGGYTSVQWWNAKQNEDFSGFDCAIINLGINDALNSVSISDTETAFRSIINALKTANNNIKIFLATIVPAYADGVTTFDAVNELIVALAEELTNCYLVDLSQYSHVSKGSAYEAGHLTAIGYRMLAQDYAGYIGYIIRTNLTAFKWVQFIGTNYNRT